MILDKLGVVTDYKHLQIREITDSGEYHRRVLTPDATLAEDEHQDVIDKAEEVWTDEVKASWTKFQEEQQAKREAE
jgi:hypothetical protein